MDLARSETWVAALDRGELDAVAACVGFARRARLTRLARFFSRLGNGWLYPIASALLLVSAAHALRYVVAAAVSIGAAAAGARMMIGTPNAAAVIAWPLGHE